MISNLYKIRWGEEELKYKKEEMMKEVWGKVKSSREIKRQRGRGNIGGRKKFFIYLFIIIFL